MTSGVSRITPCYSTVPSTFSLAGCIGNFPIPSPGLHPVNSPSAFESTSTECSVLPSRRLTSSITFRFASKGSGLGTFHTTLEPAFAFFIAPIHLVKDGANPQRRSDPGCSTNLSIGPNPPRRLLLSSLDYLRSFASCHRNLFRRTHFSQMAGISTYVTITSQTAGCSWLRTSNLYQPLLPFAFGGGSLLGAWL